MTSPYDPVRPKEVTWALAVMLVQVGLAVLSTVVTLTIVDTIRDYFREQRPGATRETIDELTTNTVGAAVFAGLVFTAVWLWLASKVRQGKNWARILTWIFAGGGVLFGLIRLGTPQSGLVRLFDVVALLLDVAIIVLLARLPAKAYFLGERATRYRAPARRRPPVS